MRGTDLNAMSDGSDANQQDGVMRERYLLMQDAADRETESFS